MPASRNRITESQKLAQRVSALPANNLLGLQKYYRSADLCLRQADVYRLKRKERDLFFILTKFASLIVETVPRHKDFQRDGTYLRFRKLLLENIMPELETLRGLIDISATRDQVEHSPDTVQLVTSNLPELDWGLVGAALKRSLSQGPSQPRVDILAGQLDTSNILETQAAPSALFVAEAANTLALPVASEAALSKHALIPKAQTRRVKPAAQQPLPLYPQFDNSPLPPIEYGDVKSNGAWGMDQQNSQQWPAAQSANMPTQSLLDYDPPPIASSSAPGELENAMPPVNPHLELQLGPQEIEVMHVPAPTQPPQPGETCCTSPPVTTVAAPPSVDVNARNKETQGVREVHVSLALMEEFMRQAVKNTRRGIESCGILAGTLSADDSVFTITTLIVPKQEGTSDTVQALNEEEIFEVQDSRSLYPLGWIHTHPTQTCFLSSVDVHTQCGYQTMLDEAVAIVMAPRDSTKKCGIFRLSTPGGLQLVQKCPQRGFHSHAPTSTGQPVYELCGHVYLNPRVKHEVIDLR